MDLCRNGAEFDAWLASACLPVSILKNITDYYGDSVHCHQAVSGSDPYIMKCVPERFLHILKKNGTDNNLQQMSNLLRTYSIGVLRFSDLEYPDKLRNIDDPPVYLFYQ